MRRYLLPSFLLLFDILIIIGASITSLFVRFDATIFDRYIANLITELPVLICSYLLFFFLFRIYRRIWRYAGVKELLAIVFSSFCGAISFWIMANIMAITIPRSVHVLTFFIVVAGMCSSRLALRYFIIRSERESQDSVNKKPVLIIGAGDAGNLIARDIAQFHNRGRKIVGFIDDDEHKQGNICMGIPVIGGSDKLVDTVQKYGVKEIIIAIPSLPQKKIREIANLCSKIKCETKIVPGIYSLLDKKITLGDLRPVGVEDLLQRDPVQLDLVKVADYLTGKCILVTGAGGSIGSELCRQIMLLKPARLLLLGRGENSIYEIHRELKAIYGSEQLLPIILNITNEEGLNDIFVKFKPQVVFHAAAHKHVPLMERNVCEAINNNVLGSWKVAKAAGENGAEVFIMISTDKAVNPTSVMGATKRVSEKIIQAANKIYKTKYVAVRFGNVLGSRGSVVPLFKEQIAKGGPVTVTDPEMKRYFMTIPEASQLVLQAGTMGVGGEVFVLDMGQPVKILDLAQNMIRLSGLEPDIDIPIKFTGLRPGEKLFEELMSTSEGTQATVHKKIFRANMRSEDPDKLREQLFKLVAMRNETKIIEFLQVIVPTYRPNHF
ncbi:MAG: nucleoside-diphosphate sugar epimerase/dehydratase [Acidaminococcaceae bacterium]|nr:nucleoside-diphosphate sugar epimerase/dehydratase [Acidaminococcaceae bacterium]